MGLDGTAPATCPQADTPAPVIAIAARRPASSASSLPFRPCRRTQVRRTRASRVRLHWMEPATGGMLRVSGGSSRPTSNSRRTVWICGSGCGVEVGGSRWQMLVTENIADKTCGRRQPSRQPNSLHQHHSAAARTSRMKCSSTAASLSAICCCIAPWACTPRTSRQRPECEQTVLVHLCTSVAVQECPSLTLPNPPGPPSSRRPPGCAGNCAAAPRRRPRSAGGGSRCR